MLKVASELLNIIVCFRSYGRRIFITIPDVGASSLGICLDNSRNIYVSGKTEISGVSGSSDNSFSAKLTNDGIVKWKKYPEISNSGSSVRIDENGQVDPESQLFYR